MTISLAPQADILMKVIKERHSGRQYNSEKDISKEQIAFLIEAARWTPSCWGEEPWRFLICQKSSDEKGYAKVFESLAAPNQKWAQEAPVFIVVTAKRTFQERPAENHWAAYDTGAAAQTMMLAATSMDLILHSMGGFSPESLRENFGISEDFQILAVMALGYAAEESLVIRTRKPIEKLFFFDTWGG